MLPDGVHLLVSVRSSAGVPPELQALLQPPVGSGAGDDCLKWNLGACDVRAAGSIEV